jgi:hypothetical protein
MSKSPNHRGKPGRASATADRSPHWKFGKSSGDALATARRLQKKTNRRKAKTSV